MKEEKCSNCEFWGWGGVRKIVIVTSSGFKKQEADECRYSPPPILEQGDTERTEVFTVPDYRCSGYREKKG